MKLAKWMLVLLLLLGALYFASSVKLGGRTLLQRVQGDTSGQVTETAKTHVGDGSQAPLSKDMATDIHTTEEQQGLEKLIEKRLDHEAAGKQADHE